VPLKELSKRISRSCIDIFGALTLSSCSAVYYIIIAFLRLTVAHLAVAGVGA